ncbi:MAG: YdcF family protein [Prevotella sp.]|nr:YdcF family protein [Prevotella sp.]
MKRIRMVIWMVGIIAVLCIAVMLICNQIVMNNAKGKVFSEIDSIKYNKVGLLLGTTPQARIGRIINYFFVYRIDAAERLYKAGKIGKILISGDENSLDGINEPECMKDSLVARGVPAGATILDGKGYRTICSVVNANKIFGLKCFTIISQEIHNERALYQAEHLGLDMENVQAYNAEIPKSRRAYLTSIREYFARVKMFWDLLTHKEEDSPQEIINSFLGRPLIINNRVYEQIAAISSKDDMLAYNDSIIQIGEVRWRVNLDLPRVVLFTSVQPDNPKMKQVVEYLNCIYGKPYDGEDVFSIKWSSSNDSLDIFRGGSTLVHLRRVYSEEGGTFLIFN